MNPMRRTAPGGFSSICLGTDEHSFPDKDRPVTPTGHVVFVKPAPGGQSTIHFGNEKPTMESTSASCHNTTDDREYVVTPRFNGPPGGKSTIHFGDHDARLVSSNVYANRSNQNAGNVLTDRPTTRLHAPPGGKTTISLGTYRDIQNKTTKRQAPAPIPKKEGKENALLKKSIGMPPRKLNIDYSKCMGARTPPGGASTIRLG
eukprot:GEMP01027264.1.p1 GENE.GEMP01027264.1~~GEMP01027264.1.p1  ORF type:complete len:222 (+),score=33.67 GEMP01027264.1:59-667(+)